MHLGDVPGDYVEDREPFYKDGKTNMLPQMSTSPQILKLIFIDFLHWADNGTEHEKMGGNEIEYWKR